MSDGSVGYLHPLNGNWDFHEAPRKSESRVAPAAIPKLMDNFRRNASAEHINWLSTNLHVSPESLNMLAVGRRDPYTWAFPMRNSRNAVVGIRLRTNDGKKFAVTGSHQGLFIPQTIVNVDLVFLPEGPTNTAAALSIGLYAIGRPSNSSGVWDIIDFIKINRVKRVVVIADTDDDRERPDGSHYNPGFDGGKSLLEQMPVPACMIALPAKDVRKYVQSGGTGELVHCLVNQALWRKP